MYSQVLIKEQTLLVGLGSIFQSMTVMCDPAAAVEHWRAANVR